MTKKFNRRKFIKQTGGVASLASLGLTGCLSGQQDSSQKSRNSVDIGYIPITDAAPLLIGHSEGFFEEEGLESNATLYRGWSNLASAFQAGDVNAAHFLFPMTYWMRYGLDFPAKVLAWDHTNGSGITVSQDIDRWEQLGGKTMGVPFWYSTHNVILQMVLRNFGLEPVVHDQVPEDGNKVRLIDLPPPDMPASLDRGDIEGYIVAEPFCALGELNTDAKMMRFTGDIWFRHGDCVLTVNENDLNNDPDWARSVVRAVAKSQIWINNNREKASKILSEEGSGLLPYSREAIDRSLNYYDPEDYPEAIKNPEWKSERVGFYPYPYPSYTKELYKRTQNTGVAGIKDFLDEISPQKVADEVVETSIIKETIQELGGSSEFGIPESEAYEREERIDI